MCLHFSLPSLPCSPTTYQVSSNHAQVFGGLFDEFLALRALLQCLQQCRNLLFVIEVRASASMSKMSNSTQTAMFYSS
jgi:hypothetical protein